VSALYAVQSALREIEAQLPAKKKCGRCGRCIS
jgi:bacterioferritin-associated ferredoxin